MARGALLRPHSTAALLAALHLLETEIRAVPAARRGAAVSLAVDRLRRLRPRGGAVVRAAGRQLTFDAGEDATP